MVFVRVPQQFIRTVCVWDTHNSQYQLLIMNANEMHYFSDLFDKVLYMFRTGPLSIIRSISTLYTANRTNMTNTYCLYSVEILLMMDSEPVRTHRVLYQINLGNSHLVGFYYKNISQSTALWMPNSQNQHRLLPWRNLTSWSLKFRNSMKIQLF